MPAMLASVLTPKLIVLHAFVALALYVHFRGRVRHRFLRQLTDHSSLLAPYNVLMYACSAVPNRPYLDLGAFPQLAPLAANWQAIRDEALRRFADGHIRAPQKHSDIGFHSFFKRGYKRFYVKWYDEPPPSARTLCPNPEISY